MSIPPRDDLPWHVTFYLLMLFAMLCLTAGMVIVLSGQGA
jgi:hypothetical protein